MKFNSDLELELGKKLPDNVKFLKGDKFFVSKVDGKYEVGYRNERDVSRSALLIVSHEDESDFKIEESSEFTDICCLVCCSCNMVLNIESVKKLIRILAMLGYNELMLHTSVTYEVDNEPAFGYLTGRYTKEEFKQIDAYAKQFGIEVIPSVQTLAHIKQLFCYKEYCEHFDIDDILLVGDERVYALIDNMFKTLSESLSSRKIHIGLDEAHKVGLGKYLNLHGYTRRFDILKEHLRRVCDIAAKYGYETIAWSDMFLNLARQSKSVDENGKYVIPDDVIKSMPQNLQLAHWDYSDKPYGRGEWEGVVTLSYDEKFDMHDPVVDKVWYASASYKLGNFIPYNAYSEKVTDLGLGTAKKHGIKRIINTIWGNDGGECSLFALLPAIAYYSYKALDKSKRDFERDFLTLTGYKYSDFLKIEYPNTWGGRFTDDYSNNTKIALYNDLFVGQFDTALNADTKKYYLEAIEAMNTVPEGKYSYLFDVSKSLCSVMLLKFDMGQRLRRAYKSNDKDSLKSIVQDMNELITRLETFLKCITVQWYQDNKPYGFEIQEYRIGGLIQRVKGCKSRVEKYLTDNAEIEELDLDLLNDALWFTNFGNGRYRFNSFVLTASVNTF